jgi:acyl carrier protein
MRSEHIVDAFLEKLTEILEVDYVEEQDVLADLDAWDSLAQLSIIALVNEMYGVTISATELKNAATIKGIKDLVENKK